LLVNIIPLYYDAGCKQNTEINVLQFWWVLKFFLVGVSENFGTLGCDYVLGASWSLKTKVPGTFVRDVGSSGTSQNMGILISKCTVMPKEEKGGLIVRFCAPYRILNLSTDLYKTWYECYILRYARVCYCVAVGNNKTVDVVGVTPAASTATPGPWSGL
jgi:hypothetical protein